MGNPWGVAPEAPFVPAWAGINGANHENTYFNVYRRSPTAQDPIAMILCTALSSGTAFGQSETSDRLQLTVTELKTIYLDCDRNAIRGLLGDAEVKACSVVYEELKKRAFDGDFDKFLAWSRAQNSANIAAR